MSRKFATLNDFRSEDRGESGNESEGEGQSFYVGGSEHSGQQVVGPSGRDPRERLFNAAREHGAEAVSDEPAFMNQHRDNPFSGSGVRLNSSVTEDLQDQPAPEVDQEVSVHLLMWEDGFSIDDGPLRAFNDPANAQFLSEITQGRTPAELVQAHGRRPIKLHMERKSGPYEPPKKKQVAFQGSGARLGSVVPNVVTNTPIATGSSSKEESANALEQAQADLKLDSNLPTTQIQIRLTNGARIIGKFNHSHTVAAVRSFIASAVPDMAFSPFQLMTLHPNKVIEDEDQSVADAGLLNSMVMVKLVA